MSTRFSPALPNRNHLLHGGDYNPDQWLDRPDILTRDIELMKQAHINTVSVGIFAWAALEPEEGTFTFGWMDDLLDRLHKNQIAAILATPSGGKPHWMALKYPEIRRVDDKGIREPQQWRHNHCYTSPVYRDKVSIMNTKLAERYGKHPAVAMWHVSNEYGGTCHCPLCKQAFRDWLLGRYKSIDAVNAAWWSRFWSHQYASFDQIDTLDTSVNGLMLDWKRFVSHQTVDFMRHELKPLRRISPHLPATINMMGFYDPLDYWKFAPDIDVVSWDAYPGWHNESVELTAAWTAYTCDLYRAMKQGKPWLLMESTPSNVNWQAVSPLKRPGVHRLSSLLTVAHGSDSVLYFQFRKGRGSHEKFHGAVVDHEGSSATRVFKEVASLGAELKQLDAVVGTTTPAGVAVVYDWENNWAVNLCNGPRNTGKDYGWQCFSFHTAFWKLGVPVDVIDSEQPLDRYRVVVAPMLYLIKPGVAERLDAFVRAGGTLITTYMTGYVDQADLCFEGGFPGGADSVLRKLVGVWAEELDVLKDDQTQTVVMKAGNPTGVTGTFKARQYFEVVHAESAKVAGTYKTDFYKGVPAVTVNPAGKGRVIHLAARFDQAFHDKLGTSIVKKLALPTALPGKLPAGVTATWRTDGTNRLTFVTNLTDKPKRVAVGSGQSTLDGKRVGPTALLKAYDVLTLRSRASKK
jgi:beta-galactosidase